MRIYSFTSTRGIPFVVKLIASGRKYGGFGYAAEQYVATQPLVEFYDGRFDHTPLGQFVSSYQLDTLTDALRDPFYPGLALDGGHTAWSVTGVELRRAIAFLTAQAQS